MRTRRTIRLRGLEVCVPAPPNFIQDPRGAHLWPVRAFSERDLRAIGKAFTEALIERAAEQVKEAAT